MPQLNFDKINFAINNLLSQKKERDAFKIIVNTYHQKIYWHVRRIVVHHDDANDVTQNTYLKIWKALPKFKGNSNIYTWIYRIATNEAITFLSKKKPSISFEDINFSEPISNFQTDLLNGNDIQLKLEKAILQLPPKQRIVFNLRYFEELKYKDIAKITDTSIGALKASYHLAVKKIENYLTTS